MNKICPHTKFVFNNCLNILDYDSFHLLGIDSRYFLFFTLYSIGLYINNIDPKNLNLNEDLLDKIIKNNAKLINIKFYRGITISKLINSFLNEIQKRNYNIIENDLNKFIDIINKNIEEIKYKDELKIIIDDDLIIIIFNEKKIGEIINKEMADSIMLIYLDENSVTPNLKKNILRN